MRSNSAVLLFALFVLSPLCGAQGLPGHHAKAPAPASAFKVPDFIKPGAQWIYRTSDSQESDDPRKTGPAAAGFQRVAVVAVLPDRVLLQAGEFINGLMSGDPYPIGGGSLMVLPQDVANRNAHWMLPAALQGLKSGNGTAVARGPFSVGGKQYQAVMVKLNIPKMVTVHFYDAGTGLLLARSTATGRPRRSGNAGGMNLKTRSGLRFQAYRVLDLPWFKAAPPAWTRTVKKLVYRGAMTQFSPGIAPLSIPRETVHRFERRVGNVHMGTMTIRTLPNQLGVPASSQEKPFSEGPAKVGGLWIPPDVLAKMRPGLLDTDPVLKSTLSYSIQAGDLGRLGVLVERHPTGSYQVVLGHDLTDGVLQYIQVQLKEMHTQVTLTLAGRE